MSAKEYKKYGKSEEDALTCIPEGENAPVAVIKFTNKSPKKKKKIKPKLDDRELWSHKLDFLFSCISVSVGLGNVWRFPYLCYKNGGGAFLICYFISMIFCGVPIFFQEVAIGQYLGSGGMTLVGKLCPILGGTGYATMTIVFLLDVYYCIIVAWTMLYLYNSIPLYNELPWKYCDHAWNTEYCSANITRGKKFLSSVGLFSNFTNNISDTVSSVKNVSEMKTVLVTPAEEFWTKRILMITPGIEQIGGMQWELFIMLGLVWLIIYLILGKGLHQSGKIVWFTALFPYFIIVALLICSVTLDGAMDGFYYLFTTDWKKLKSAETWIDGATQIFFGYSLGVGTLPALGSYNSFKHNCYRDAIITCIINTLTCLLCSIVTFCILGFMAYDQNTTVEEVVESGPGLVFITYPEVVLKLPAASLWAIIFFVMLAMIGIDSEFCNVESFITGLIDKWSSVLRPRRRIFAFAVCFTMFIFGIPMVTHGGMYIFQLFDFYSASGLSLLWVCFFQTIAISWFFGASKFSNCVQQMLGFYPNRFLYICWVFLAPLVMSGVFIFFIIHFEPVKYGNNYTYPKWGEWIGIGISLISMIWIPIYALYYMLKEKGTFMERLKRGLTPHADLLRNPKMDSSSKSSLTQTNPSSESKVVLLSSQTISA